MQRIYAIKWLETLTSWRTGLLAMMLMVLSFVAQAQDAPAADAASGGGGGRSYFQMFFVSEDPIGQLIIVLLVLMSMVSMSLTIYFSMQARKKAMLPDMTQVRLSELLGQKRWREAIEFAQSDTSFLGRVCYGALNEASQGYQAMERAIEEAADVETTRALRPIEYLNVLGNVSPMIGLFGTVYGMIVAFQDLVAAQGRPDPAQLAAGISTALVTTLWGLVVAIPAIAAYAMVRNRVDGLSAEAVVAAQRLIEPFRRRRQGAAQTQAAQQAPAKG